MPNNEQQERRVPARSRVQHAGNCVAGGTVIGAVIAFFYKEATGNIMPEFVSIGLGATATVVAHELRAMLWSVIRHRRERRRTR